MSTATEMTPPSIHDDVWPDIKLPPTDLPYDDGVPMESPWHRGAGELLRAGYVAARGGRRDDYYVGVNMFVYSSMRQVRNQDFKGPDVFIVKDVDGQKYRNSWIAWDEDGRLPDVIFDLLSASTEETDLGDKKYLYERTFRASEYFCIASEVERLLGWRLERKRYVPLIPDTRGWLWSEELGLWLGPWQGTFIDEEHIWPRFYYPDGRLVLLPSEVEAQRSLEAELQRLKANTGTQ